MTEAELKSSVKNPSGGYFFWGDEDYLKKYYSSAIRKNVLGDDPAGDFNYILLNEDNYAAGVLSQSIATPPLMSDRRMVEVSFANYSFLSEKERKAFEEAIASVDEYPETVLLVVIAAGGFDGGSAKRPSPQLKALSAHLKCAEFKYQSENKLARWIERHINEYGLFAESAALYDMIRFCGRSMLRLFSETQKVCAYAKSKNENVVSQKTVAHVVSRTPEEDAFMLANSVLEGNKKDALEWLGRAKRRDEPPMKLMASVSNVFCDMASVAHYLSLGADKRTISAKTKMHEYRAGLYIKAVSGIPLCQLDRTVSLCVEAERKMKTISFLGYIPLERLICEALDGTADKIPE